uniref:TBC1 domain family member 15 (Trinotate prediction) n=1 Tax=Henneguya salminicola TaxID=69463 RepID=A0A6G3MF45_HENSL
MQREDEYYRLKEAWTNLSPDAECFQKVKLMHDMISKDVPRCDRMHAFFYSENNGNLKDLQEILNTYMFYRHEQGYDQSMPDLVSPFLYLVKNKPESFWLFVNLMNFREKIFHVSELNLYDVLCDLTLLIKFFFPTFYSHQNWDLFYISSFFGRLKLDFKRDYGLENILRLWEVFYLIFLFRLFGLKI